MPWNGSGVFTRIRNWVNEAAVGTPILPAEFDEQEQDFVVAGFGNCITRDGQGGPTADIPWNNFGITGMRAPALGTDASNKAYVDLATGDRSMGGYKITALGNPVAGTDAVNLTTLNATAMNAALPNQTGNAGKIVITNGVTATWTDTYTIAIKEKKGADIASTATLNLSTATGNLVHVTGTTNITAITIASGAEYTLVFDGAVKITNGANLILPSGADITTAAGDSIKVRGDGTAARVVSYERKEGRSLLGIPRMTVTTATGTWTCPDTVTLVEVSMVDGGDGGYNTTGGSGFGYKGADSGAGGVSVLTVTPGTVYTVTVGSGGAIGTVGYTTGGASSFAGAGLTTMTTANATFKVPKGTGGNPSAAAGASGINGIGGTSMLGAPGRTTVTSGYGAGGMGGFDNTSGATAGANGVVIIRY